MCLVTNRFDDIQPLIQDDRIKINSKEPELFNNLLNDYKELLQLFKQKNDFINQFWDVLENKNYQLAQDILDPLEQILYSSLLGIRTLDQEAQSDSTKEYLASLKKEIEKQLIQLKEASISVYPICMQDLGPYGAIKSYYELLKEGNNITIDIHFKGTLKRQPHKIEITIFRFIQQLIQIIDNLKTISSLSISVYEMNGQIALTFEGVALVQRLKDCSKYQLFKELVDSIEDVKMLEQSESQLNLVLQTNKN